LEAKRVWDLPTRLFHWALAVCVIGSIASAKIGGNAMVWHFRFGYAIFALLAFRLIWGFVGGRWSRFASFVRGPGTVLRYLRGQQLPGEHLDAGHNPLGALSVLALLAFLAIQVATGLVADDEIANSGPLVRFVSGATSQLATGWHTDVGQWILIALVVLHLAAIGVYAWRGQRLVGPMLTGDKALPAAVPASADSTRQRLLALLIAAACGAGVAAVVGLGA
jgi:cytochrome b